MNKIPFCKYPAMSNDLLTFMDTMAHCDAMTNEVKAMGYDIITTWHLANPESSEEVMVRCAVIQDDAEAVMFKLRYGIDPGATFPRS